jgi:DNA ligase-1
VSDTWRDVRASSGRLDKRRRMAQLFERLEGDDLRLAALYLSGELPQSTIGVGWSQLSEALKLAPAGAQGEPLTLRDVDACFESVAATSGAGSLRARKEALAGLLARASPEERDLLSGLLMGELRQGALRALVVEAIAAARRVDPAALRKAVMNAGSLGAVAGALAAEGERRWRASILRPWSPSSRCWRPPPPISRRRWSTSAARRPPSGSSTGSACSSTASATRRAPTPAAFAT